MVKYLPKISSEPYILSKTYFSFSVSLYHSHAGAFGMEACSLLQPEAFLKFLTVPEVCQQPSFEDSRAWHNHFAQCLCKKGMLLAGLRSPLEISAHSRWDCFFRREADSGIMVTCADMWPSKTPMGPGHRNNPNWQCRDSAGLSWQLPHCHTAPVMYSLPYLNVFPYLSYLCTYVFHQNGIKTLFGSFNFQLLLHTHHPGIPLCRLPSVPCTAPFFEDPACCPILRADAPNANAQTRCLQV